MKFLILFPITLLASFAYADNDVSSAVANVTNIIDRTFHGSLDAYQAKVQSVFEQLDKNKDGVVNEQDISALVNHTFGAIQAKSKYLEKFIGEQLKDMDSNEDGSVSWDEFWATMKQYGQTPFTVDASICDKAESKVDECDFKFDLAKPFFKLRVEANEKTCESGSPALGGYPLQKCILAAADCQAVQQCYFTDFSKTENNQAAAAALVKRSDIQLEKRDGGVLKIMYWVGVVAFAILALPSIFLIPFWVVLIIVGLRIDWSMI